MRIGLYFGSFNPIHVGHVQIAQKTLDQFHLDEVWLMVSPQNPFKETNDLAPDQDRLAMARLASEGIPNLYVNDLEFSLPRPSFTITTVKLLRSERPNSSFYLIMGEDNLHSLHLWKNAEDLLQLVEVIVYPREAQPVVFPAVLQRYRDRIHSISGNIIPVSATEIRAQFKARLTPNDMLHPRVLQYIQQQHLYS
jgi:nicotinate-nucleotide adenylyltransferase